MRYWLCIVVGVAIFAGCIYAFSEALTTLLENGTCASGNTPYEISRPCPEGTGTSVLLLIGSIFGILIAAAVFAARGRGRGSGRSVAGPYLAGWGIFFTATGAVSLVHSLSSDTIGADGKLGGTIVGAVFLVMGLPVLAVWLWSALSGLRGSERPVATWMI